MYCSRPLLFVNKYSGIQIYHKNRTELCNPVLPSIQHLDDIEARVRKEYNRRVKKRVKKSSEFEGRRYVIYDRKPEEKKKKIKVKMNRKYHNF